MASNPASNAAPSSKQASIGEIDTKMAQFLTRIHDSAGSGDSPNDQLVKYLKDVMSNANLVTAPLPRSKDAGLTKLTSDDGKVCFYSWDTETGGTMHFYDDFVQFKTRSGSKWRDLNPPSNVEGDLRTGYFLHDLHTVTSAEGKSVYLPTYRSVFSNPNHSDGITAYAIEGEKFVEVPFFKTKTKVLKSIDVPATENQWNENGLIKFKDHNKTLLIPITVKDGGATGKFLTYRFNGHQFVFDEKAHEKP